MYSFPNFEEVLKTKRIANIQDVGAKVVLLRTCLNVALDSEGNISEPQRLEEALPTIEDLAERAKALVIVGHLGRPEGQDPKFSLETVRLWFADKIDGLLFARSIDEAKQAIEQGSAKVILLENIRFFEGEESKDPNVRDAFAKELASLADVFVNDAFADYRPSASTYDVVKYLHSFIGPIFHNEVSQLSYLSAPEEPYVAILGGAKLSEKLDTLHALLPVADKVIIGGAMAYTLLKAAGYPVGKSLVEEDKLEIAEEMINQYADKLILPLDHRIANEFSESAESSVTDGIEIPDDMIAIDIGPQTIDWYVSEIGMASTLLINGPMGVFEWTHSAEGTRAVLQAISDNDYARRIAGGGDTIAAINKLGGFTFDHISTGGGAMLAYISYDTFPTLDIILKKGTES